MKWIRFNCAGKAEEVPEPVGPQPVSCKRCGVMYMPRFTQSMIEIMGMWDTFGHKAAFRSDEHLLVAQVNPQDYCPRCEEHLQVARNDLLLCLKGDHKAGFRKMQEMHKADQAMIRRQAQEIGMLRRGQSYLMSVTRAESEKQEGKKKGKKDA